MKIFLLIVLLPALVFPMAMRNKRQYGEEGAPAAQKAPEPKLAVVAAAIDTSAKVAPVAAASAASAEESELTVAAANSSAEDEEPTSAAPATRQAAPAPAAANASTEAASTEKVKSAEANPQTLSMFQLKLPNTFGSCSSCSDRRSSRSGTSCFS
jgi:hypothetical protein